MEEIRKAYEALTHHQFGAVRKRLERWRDAHEDDAMLGQENPASGRRRYAYPAHVVQEAVAEVLGRPPRKLKGK
jgi:hypothetical protein